MNSVALNSSMSLICSLGLGSWLVVEDHAGYGLTVMILGFMFALTLLVEGKKI